MKDTHTGFPGTYFNKESLLKISKAAEILAWVVAAIYGLQLLITLGVNLSQMLGGSWAGMRFVDILQNFISIFVQALPGGAYFFVLMGISKLLLIIMDIEDNTRRAARK